MAAPKKYAVTVWYMEYRDPKTNANKFYQVFISESGICVLRWGRIGAATGSNSCTAYATYDEARDVGLRQVYSKKAKGYVQQYGDMQYMASLEALNRARGGDPGLLASEFQESLNAGEYEGAKETVLKHYADFSERVKVLMDRAAGGEFEQVMTQYEELERVWEEINDKHAEVEAAMSIAKMTLAQKLMAGSI